MLPLQAASNPIASVANARNAERFMGNRLSDQAAVIGLGRDERGQSNPA
jgi:hypothetical protein